AIVDHRVAEAADVPARFPDLRVHQQRAVEADHAVGARRAVRRRGLVVVQEHVLPPRLLQIALALDAERTVIPRTVEAAVDLARREYEPPSFAQRHDLVHRLHWLLRRGPSKRGAQYSDATRCSQWRSRSREATPSATPQSFIRAPR